MPSSNRREELTMESFLERDRQERLASSSLTTETLSKLNVPIEKLPLKCQQWFPQLSEAIISSGLAKLDSVTMTIHQNKNIAERMEEDYEILLLRQKNTELQIKCDRNKKFLEQLRKDLEVNRSRLNRMDPNPNNIQDYCKELKLKIATFEKIYEKAKLNTKKIPPEIMPQALMPLMKAADELEERKAEAELALEDARLANEAMRTLLSLRSNRN